MSKNKEKEEEIQDAEAEDIGQGDSQEQEKEQEQEEQQETAIVLTKKIDDIEEYRKERNLVGKLDDFTTVEDMITLASYLIASRLIPTSLRTPEKVVTVIQQGRELGLGAVTALNNIHVIEGRPTLSVHAIAALIKKAGVEYKILKDGIEENGTKVTTIRFYKLWNGIIIENDISYSWREAEIAGYVTKYNWKKYPKIMLRTRCLTIGARFVAPDALLGMMETSEMLDSTNIDFDIDDEGHVTKKK